MEEIVKEIPQWKKNQLRYINEYSKKPYHRMTVQLTKIGEEEKLWNALSESNNKNRTLIELALLGLSVIRN